MFISKPKQRVQCKSLPNKRKETCSKKEQEPKNGGIKSIKDKKKSNFDTLEQGVLPGNRLLPGHDRDPPFKDFVEKCPNHTEVTFDYFANNDCTKRKSKMFNIVCMLKLKALTLRHLARPRPALSADVAKVAIKRIDPMTPSPKKISVSSVLSSTKTTMKNVMMSVVGTASVKTSFSITFLSRCFFFCKAFFGCFQKR